MGSFIIFLFVLRVDCSRSTAQHIHLELVKFHPYRVRRTTRIPLHHSDENLSGCVLRVYHAKKVTGKWLTLHHVHSFTPLSRTMPSDYASTMTV